MEAEGAIEGLCEEATCSICLEYFIDPVTIDCGHNFCQACFDQLWEDPNVDSSCPQCRERIKQRNFKPNRQLANIVEIVKNFQERKGLKRKWEEPQRQQEPPKFFWDAQAPAGVVWDRLLAHQGHAASSVSKISVKYKAQLETEKQKIRSAFQRMQAILRAKQRLWLGELGDLEKKIWKRAEGNFAELSGELSRLSNLIVAMEARNLQPSCDVLQPPRESLQDIRRALTRCEKNASEHESDLSHWWDETLKIAVEKCSALEKATENYKASLEQVQDTAPLMQDLNKVDVTLDPNTAHPCLTVSEDLKCVWWEVKNKRKGGKKKKKKSNNRGATGNLPDNPERFNLELCVLGQEGFTAGKHWWVVEVEAMGRAMWSVGVARDTMRRKGIICTNTSEGVWAVGRFSRSPTAPCQFFASTCPAPTPLALAKDPQNIRVSLDYERGQVQFSDADNGDLIFTYHTGSFSGERLRPFFQVRRCGTALKCWPLSPDAVNRNDNARTATGNLWFSGKFGRRLPSAVPTPFHSDHGWLEF